MLMTKEPTEVRIISDSIHLLEFIDVFTKRLRIVPLGLMGRSRLMMCQEYRRLLTFA
jgi:hypothetical protein